MDFNRYINLTFMRCKFLLSWYLDSGYWSNLHVFLQLFPDQIQMLLDAFKNPPQTREEGLYFEDKQYKCVRADKNSIYAKSVSTVIRSVISYTYLPVFILHVACKTCWLVLQELLFEICISQITVPFNKVMPFTEYT